MGNIWDLIILQPVLNVLIATTTFAYHNFGLAILLLTVVVRVILLPTTFSQMRSTKAMQSLQPKMQELQKKYGRTNPQKLNQEVMKLYKEAGISPLGCLWPMLIQMPIWIALYQSIMRALAATPEDLLALSQNLYSWDIVRQAIPLNENFLWWNLAQPDPYLVLAVLVGGTMWVQQKMVTAPATDPRQAQMTQMTTLMMPLMFGLFTLSFPSGLALYWVVSNIIGIVLQYFISGGWGYLLPPSTPQPPSVKRIAAETEESPTIKSAAQKKKGLFGK
jgi:YidC/Oxa1 family membrane protein insertase